MFRLRVHSVDVSPSSSAIAHHQESETSSSNTSATWTTTTTTSSSNRLRRNPNPNLSDAINDEIQEIKGIVHLYHASGLPQQELLDDSLLPVGRNTLLFVIAVPSRLSLIDFLHFCGSHVDHFSQVWVIRNDRMEDRYGILIELKDQKSADGFYTNLNGRRFSSSEAEVCHLLFTVTVEYTDSTEIAGTPPQGFTELPTCAVCLERLDQDTSGILATTCDHSFQCSCMSKWASSSCSICRFCQRQSEKPTCTICSTSENLWICMICGFVGCGRYKERHAVSHWQDTQHCYSLNLETQRIWDYPGDRYVHRLNQSKADGKLIKSKSHCSSLDGSCGSCECIEDAGVSGALYSSKVDTIVDEYNRLLTSQLENQRLYYESLLVEARGKREKIIAEAVEQAVNLKLQDFQTRLEECIKKKNIATEINEKLTKNQNFWREKVQDIEERERTTLKLKGEKIQDLEEQIRDITVFIEAQRLLDGMTESENVKGGTLLPVPQQQTSTGNTSRRSSRTNRRRR
ncbi:hypothetical protein QJS10_CPA05g00120 [Acorus calamus]|uniref:BRCA1-associated protein n=1 Tax=Acorus calamus TaxID=4465 RepID=A0AAV9ES07_ACOCL|nr:hypothetical protein QJS10_CPA05g00120 [Acorus calamus]